MKMSGRGEGSGGLERVWRGRKWEKRKGVEGMGGEVWRV